jgi:hypothetical protein
MAQELSDVLKKTCTKKIITLQKLGTPCVPILRVYFKTLAKKCHFNATHKNNFKIIIKRKLMPLFKSKPCEFNVIQCWLHLH